VVLLAASAARANVRSQMLYARGLLPFNGGRWEEAYQLFNQAVEADANDAVAWYYRGLTEARQGMTDEAIRDIQKALGLNPKLPHASLDLGIAYLSAGKQAEAKRSLEQAYQEGYEQLTAAFFLGLTHFRLGDDAAALKSFTEAKADPEVRGAAQYYSGLLLVKQGQTEAARPELEGAAHDLQQSEAGRAAQDYLLTGGVEAANAAPPWSIGAGVHLEYDSNVTIGSSSSLAPSTTRDISGKSDGRFVVDAGGRYTFLDTAGWSLRGSYDFSQSVHFVLTDYDLQGHRLGLGVESQSGRFRYGIAGQYNFFALNYQTFYQEGLGTPWVTVGEGENAATQVSYTVRGRDFFRAPYDPGRDAINHSFAVRQFVDLGEYRPLLSLGYQFDLEDPISNGPQGMTFEYTGNQVDIDVVWPIADLLRVHLAYLYRHEDYDSFNSGYGVKKRKDDAHQFVAGMERDLNDNWTLDVHYLGVINGSNVPDFDYDRHIVSAGVRFNY
jgi:tetratricopeptide (TPR) repeat protein